MPPRGNTDWAGRLGDDYTRRNMTGDQTAFFAPIVTLTGPLESVIEFGPNVGLNLSALRRIFPEIEVAGVEVNQGACAELQKRIPDAAVYQCPADRFETDRTYDLALTKSFLIHIPPQELDAVTARLYQCVRRWLLLAEYYNPRLVEAHYRNTVLWKRDFAGEMLDRYPGLPLVAHGFNYHLDEFPQDDITWFLLKRVPW